MWLSRLQDIKGPLKAPTVYEKLKFRIYLKQLLRKWQDTEDSIWRTGLVARDRKCIKCYKSSRVAKNELGI